nr:hypothetical protein [uncultured Mediterranean phage uvMED]
MKKIRTLIAEIYWQLKRDHEYVENYSDITYDVGYIMGLCFSINKKNLADKIYQQFMND